MIYTTTIKGTNNAQSQEIIKNLDPREDLLFVYGDITENAQPVEIQYIKPINDIKTIGLLDAELVKEITANHGEEISVSVSGYELTFEDGVYGITADIEVEDASEDDEVINKQKNLPLPLLLAVGALTGILTVVLVIIKIFNKNNEK